MQLFFLCRLYFVCSEGSIMRAANLLALGVTLHLRMTYEWSTRWCYLCRMLTCCLLSHCVGDDRSTDTTGQCHVRAAGEPSLDPASHRDSGASVSATAAIAWPQLTTIPPPFTPSANQRPWNVQTGVRIGPVLWTTWTRWRLAEWRIW